ncbi:MAG TPA: hypothetical protein VK918_06865 [Pyrinomonadaceae bacterium]|nr:hypothetical protein [Pyrinomonadaceae bacterium]
MREAIFILIVLLIVIGLTLYKYRRQVGFALEVWRMLRKMRTGSDKKLDASAETPKGPLINCTRCGTWVPAGSAIKLGGASYCSARCVETTAHTG